MKSVFDFDSYKEYLNWREQRWESRGFRHQLSQALDCQPSYVSQVLNDKNDFSLEQAAKCQELLGHSAQETHFFMLLLQLERAGTPLLEDYFRKQIRQIRDERKFLQNRLDHKAKLKKEDQHIYYSSHLYSLIHIALTIESLRTPTRLAEKFGLPLDTVREALEFLTSCGLAKEDKAGHFEVGPAQIHMGRESKIAVRHHANYRVKALENLDLANKLDLHYSTVVSYSENDWPQIREILVKALEDVQKVIKDSPAENVFVLNTDLFAVK